MLQQQLGTVLNFVNYDHVAHEVMVLTNVPTVPFHILLSRMKLLPLISFPVLSNVRCNVRLFLRLCWLGWILLVIKETLLVDLIRVEIGSTGLPLDLNSKWILYFTECIEHCDFVWFSIRVQFHVIHIAQFICIQFLVQFLHQILVQVYFILVAALVG